MSKPNHLYVVPDETPRITPVGFDGGEPPMSNLEKRVEKLEEQLSKVNTDLEVLKSNNASGFCGKNWKPNKMDSRNHYRIIYLLAWRHGRHIYLVS